MLPSNVISFCFSTFLTSNTDTRGRPATKANKWGLLYVHGEERAIGRYRRIHVNKIYNKHILIDQVSYTIRRIHPSTLTTSIATELLSCCFNSAVGCFSSGKSLLHNLTDRVVSTYFISFFTAMVTTMKLVPSHLSTFVNVYQLLRISTNLSYIRKLPFLCFVIVLNARSMGLTISTYDLFNINIRSSTAFMRSWFVRLFNTFSFAQFLL